MNFKDREKMLLQALKISKNNLKKNKISRKTSNPSILFSKKSYPKLRKTLLKFKIKDPLLQEWFQLKDKVKPHS
jgi:hypothetical protein